MNQLPLIDASAATGAPVTMSSREIAELTGKEHRNVMRDIRAMLAELHGDDRVLSFEQTVMRSNPSGGAPIPSQVFNLPKRETLILVSGYSVELRARIIDRWQELEAKASAPTATLAQDPVMARLAAMRASGLLSPVAAEVASFRLLGLQPPKALMDALRPAPAPSQTAAQSPLPLPTPEKRPKSKPARKPTPIKIGKIPFGGLDGCNFIVEEIAPYVVGGMSELKRAMRDFGLINETGVPTSKGRGLVTRKGVHGHHWKVAELLRFVSGRE